MKVFRLSVLSLVLTVSGGILALAAQNRTVSGKVLDAQQQPIVGVAVLVDGTTRGTTTSENGSFTLDIPAGEVVLNATYLGYIPQKVTVPSSKSEVTIYLQEDAIQLEEAVVIGYGTQKRVNLTGARLDGEQQGTRKPRHPFGDQHVAGFRSGPEHHHVVG